MFAARIASAILGPAAPRPLLGRVLWGSFGEACDGGESVRVRRERVEETRLESGPGGRAEHVSDDGPLVLGDPMEDAHDVDSRLHGGDGAPVVLLLLRLGQEPPGVLLELLHLVEEVASSGLLGGPSGESEDLRKVRPRVPRHGVLGESVCPR
jgi:hypothetical protein